MATAFKNAVLNNAGVGPATLYTAPGATTSLVIGLSVCNITANTVKTTVQLTDTSAGVTVDLVKDLDIPAGMSVIIVGGEQKLVLEATDLIVVSGNTASSMDVVGSVMELT